ncbi:MAG: SMC-Scp complex subunit ScpB [Gammaproteobacteria bacterium]|nr:SMC-Scp complex subunit ScpB [Gammaproteobacteria bacterium]
MEATEIKHFIEAALLAAGRPLNIDQLKGLFDGRTAPEKTEIRQAIATLNEEYDERGIVISEVASGFRMQVKAAMADRLQKLWEDRPPRYSRALFETLALIAYRQPITRGDIEEIRGVSVSSNITRQLLERDWVRVVGHRDVPGRPAMFGTTKSFLDYFGLKKLDDLPPLADLSDWESLPFQLNLPDVEDQSETAAEEAVDAVVSDLPVLYPEDSEEDDSDEEYPDEDAVAEALAKAEAVKQIPELQPVVEEPVADESDEELVVNEWPDPVV